MIQLINCINIIMIRSHGYQLSETLKKLSSAVTVQEATLRTIYSCGPAKKACLAV